MTEYDEVKCRVPKGLLKEGEMLEWRPAIKGERRLSLSGDKVMIWDQDETANDLVVIPAFNSEAAEKWADENLPKPACKEQVCISLANDDRRYWYWRVQGNGHNVPEEFIGPTPWPADWKQARFEWCEWRLPSPDGTRVHVEWRWVWRPEGGAKFAQGER